MTTSTPTPSPQARIPRAAAPASHRAPRPTGATSRTPASASGRWRPRSAPRSPASRSPAARRRDVRRPAPGAARVEGAVRPRRRPHARAARAARPPLGPAGDAPLLRAHQPAPGRRRPQVARFEKGPDSTGYENIWHSDVTWRADPSLGSLLHAIEVPDVGGDTLWADMGAAYDGLHDAREGAHRRPHRRARLDRHVRRGDDAAQQRDALRPDFPRRRAPGRAHAPRDRAQDALRERAPSPSTSSASTPTRAPRSSTSSTARPPYPEYQCRCHWSPGDLAIWDNRATQHYAVVRLLPPAPGHGAHHRHRRPALRVNLAGRTAVVTGAASGIGQRDRDRLRGHRCERRTPRPRRRRRASARRRDRSDRYAHDGLCRRHGRPARGLGRVRTRREQFGSVDAARQRGRASHPTARVLDVTEELGTA